MRRSGRTNTKSCIIYVCILAFLWTGAMITGVLLCTCDHNFVSLMRIATQCNVSIVGVLVVGVLPVIISIVSLASRKRAIIYIFIILKAFLSGYVLYAVAYSFGTAGWLIRILLLYSDNWTNGLILWFVLCHFQGVQGTFLNDSIVCIVFSIMIGITDYLLIGPFLCSIAG